MKNFVKVATLAATLALAACQTNPNTNVSPKQDPVKSRNVADTEGQIWKSGDYSASNGTDKLCWNTGYYPDGNPIAGCDAMPKPVVVDKKPDPIKQNDVKFNFDAGALFDFDQATLRPVGQQVLSALASALKSVSFGRSIVVGHTDSFGSDAYNDRLSARRAEAVKSFLVSQGISANAIQTSGMGKRQLLVPAAACKGNRAAQIACQQPNRRVSVGLTDVVVPANQVDKWNSFLRSIPGVQIK
ncbi:MAG: OmpA family protein [Formosimonas sp.]